MVMQPNAHQRRCVVLAIGNSRVSSVAELARRLGAYRSAISRSLHRLEVDGLAVYQDGRWVLTEAGQAQRVVAEQMVQATVDLIAEAERAAANRRERMVSVLGVSEG